MTLAQCPRCHNYSFTLCDCQQFRYWYGDGDDVNNLDEATIVYATNNRAAAELAAKDYWIEELLSPEDCSDLEVWISEGLSQAIKFNVKVEITVSYTASEAKVAQ